MPTLASPSARGRHWAYVLLAFSGVLVLVFFVGAFSDEIATHVVRRRFAVIAPAEVRPGETVRLRWGPVSQANRRRYPREWIGLVYSQGPFTGIYTLARRTQNDGQELVRIPNNLPPGVRAVFRVTAYNRSGRILYSASTDSRPVTVLAAAPPVVAPPPKPPKPKRPAPPPVRQPPPPLRRSAADTFPVVEDTTSFSEDENFGTEGGDEDVFIFED